MLLEFIRFNFSYYGLERGDGFGTDDDLIVKNYNVFIIYYILY